MYLNAIQAFVPPEVVKTVSAFLEFCYIARQNIISDDSLEQLKISLHNFHQFRQIFSGTVRAEGLSGFSLPRQHSMVHYYDHIKNFGSPNGLCSSITESKHIAAVKRPWRRSNKHMPLQQMLKTNERLDKIAAARIDFTARGMLVDSCLVQAIRDILSSSEDPMDEDSSNSGSDSETSDEEIQISGAGLGAENLPANNNNIDNHDNSHDDDHDNNGCNNDDYDDNGRNDNDNNDGCNDNDNNDGRNNDNNNGRNDDCLHDDNDSGDEDNHGPVESGPLMNEVRFVGRKGEDAPHHCHHHRLRYCSQRLQRITLHRFMRSV